MTLLEAVRRLDDLEPNIIPREAKYRWLSELDGMVWRSVICTHLPAPGVPGNAVPPESGDTDAGSTGTGSAASGSTASGSTADTGSTSAIRPAVPIGAARAGAPLPAPEPPPFPGYGPDADGETLLLVPAPYDALYPHYLAAQINFVNGEAERYNAETALLNDFLTAFESDYNRTHTPVNSGRFRF